MQHVKQITGQADHVKAYGFAILDLRFAIGMPHLQSQIANLKSQISPALSSAPDPHIVPVPRQANANQHWPHRLEA